MRTFSGVASTNKLLVFWAISLLALSGCQSRPIASQVPAPSQVSAGKSGLSISSISETLLSGATQPLKQYLGQVILVSNLSLKCGTTPQIGAIEELFLDYKDRGFVVLGFPSDSFTGEDLSNFKAVAETCATRFGVTFPLFKPGPVRGNDAREIFRFVTTSGPEETRGEVAFNLEKFLIDRRGRVRFRFGSFTPASSEELRSALEILLQEKESP
jgi:glutathione peroxidase